MANSVRWYGDVLRREDGHVLRRALNFEVEGQWKKGRLKRTWKKQVEEESVKVGLLREDALCRSQWSVGVDLIGSSWRWIWPPSHVVEYIWTFNNGLSLCDSGLLCDSSSLSDSGSQSDWLLLLAHLINRQGVVFDE